MSLSLPIYLDYNATCPLAEEVIKTIENSLRYSWANPSSASEAGKMAKLEIEKARSEVASLVNAATEENIIFTSGGTEANNFALLSAVDHYHTMMSLRNTLCNGSENNQPGVITSSIEHDSIALLLRHLEQKKAIDLSIVPVNSETGAVDVEQILQCITSRTCLITLMLANNETGVIQPVEEIGRRLQSINAARDLKILLHTDAAQAIGKIKVDVDQLHVDYLTIVGHKFYGPRNGALFARVKNLKLGAPILFPVFFGGGQERNYRPGTENTPMIAGLGEAARLVHANLSSYWDHMKNVRDYFESLLINSLGADRVKVNFADSPRLPNTSSVVFRTNCTSSELLRKCQAFTASTGAACHTHQSSGAKASQVLLACGLDVEAAQRTVRFSFGRCTSKSDVERVVDELTLCVDLF